MVRLKFQNFEVSSAVLYWIIVLSLGQDNPNDITAVIFLDLEKLPSERQLILQNLTSCVRSVKCSFSAEPVSERNSCYIVQRFVPVVPVILK